MNKLIITIIFPIILLAQGSLMLVGGGKENYNDWSDLPYQWFVNKADSGIIINIDVDEASDWYPSYFRSLGANNDSQALQIANKTAANDSATYKLLVRAKGIFMEGGNQWDYVSTWKNTLVAEAIKKVFAEGGVIGGTSAGLAVLGEVVFDAKFGSSYPDEAAENCRHSDIHLSNDLFDLMPGVLTDSHFHPRGRMGRLVPMMAKWTTDTGQELIGIGVDDKTAFCVDENYKGIVYGKASVTIVRPTENSVCESIAGEPVRYTNLRFDQLVHGIEYDLNKLTATNAEDKLQPFDYQEESYNYTALSLDGNDDNILNYGMVEVGNLTSSETNAWYGRLSLSDGLNTIPNSVIINKIWGNNDYYENRFMGGLYAIGENPGITAIYLGKNSTLDVDANGNCTVGNYTYFIDSRRMTYYGFPQKNDPTAPIPASNHPAIINARLHYFKDGDVYSLTDSTAVGIDKSGKIGEPIEFEVGYNYPNPFNNKTCLNFTLPEQSDIRIKIYDMKGSDLYSYSKANLQPGRHQFSWNALDNKGRNVSAGVYLLTVSGDNIPEQKVRKLLYLK
ncbi:MAG: Type 1 glutamine amidotransferase-like domain-containing protein [Fidelibacterota bacterium]